MTLKRSGFKPRTKPLRATAPAKAELPTSRCKAKGCRVKFVKLSMNHRACSVECAIAVRAQDKAEEARKEAREYRAKLADSKKLSHWVDLTERVVHRYIHARDRGLSCISCGTRSTVQWEAGHWLTKAARPEIRFDPRNINLQCHRCNEHLSGNQAAYRIGLVAKIGEDAVKELEGPHPTAKYTREGLAAIRKEFAAMTRALERQQ
jgi:hypothetical protein